MHLQAARLLSAMSFAANRHSSQRRKGGDDIPYINHPIDVATILAVEGGIDDEAVLMAAALHDTVEDTPTTLGELEELFGAEVAGLVAQMTDDKSLPKMRRKALQVEHAPELTQGAKLLKIADKISNVRDLAAHPPRGWSRERQVEYLDWTEEVVAGCRGVNGALERSYDQALAHARQVVIVP